MNQLVPLMRREWLQHRFGWSLLVLVPLALALLLLSFGEVEIGDDGGEMRAAMLPVLLAFAAIAGSASIVFLTLLVTSLFIVSGLPRRDHGDRSIEFWLSLPIGHVRSLAVPLLVHLILVPAAGLGVGLLGGYVLSLALVTRVAGIGAWFGLPWGDIMLATGALALRLAAGLPVALLWLAPLILLVMLFTALFKRWGVPILAVSLGLGGVVLEYVFGQPMLSLLIRQVAENAARALVGAGGQGFGLTAASATGAALRELPGWALRDFGAAVTSLFSPTLVGGVLVAAACFAALVFWRRRGASASV